MLRQLIGRLISLLVNITTPLGQLFVTRITTRQRLRIISPLRASVLSMIFCHGVAHFA